MVVPLLLSSLSFAGRAYITWTYARGWVRIVIPLGNSYGPPLTATPIAY